MSGALVAATGERKPFEAAQEAAGLGVRATVDGVEHRLGSQRY